MTISAAPLIYILIFVAVLALVEGVYLTVFGKSISLNNRLSRRLSLLEKNNNREEVLEQLRKEMSQHMSSRGIPLYSILATKAQKANIAFSPGQLIMMMGALAVFSIPWPDHRHRNQHHRAHPDCHRDGGGRHLCLGQQQGQETHGFAGRTAA